MARVSARSRRSLDIRALALSPHRRCSVSYRYCPYYNQPFFPRQYMPGKNAAKHLTPGRARFRPDAISAGRPRCGVRGAGPAFPRPRRAPAAGPCKKTACASAAVRRARRSVGMVWNHGRQAGPQASSFALARPARSLNDFWSLTARSASILRLMLTPASFRPCISLL